MAEKEKKGFVLADVLDGVSKSGTEGRKQIEYIDIDLIYPDPKNREIKNIQEMADSIAMNGLSAPLDLRLHPEIEGAYMVVSGHRRRAGLLLLVEEDPEKWRKVPCIVDCAQRSEAEWRMKNLDANMQTQELTDAERAAHAAEVTDLIYRLKEEGHEFPGRVRDWVAEKCKISASKLARLKVIQDKLVAPKFVAMWKAGELKEDPAYVLAQMPALMQEAIAKYRGTLPAANVLRMIQGRGMEHYLSTPVTCKSGEGCTNGERFLYHDLADGHWGVGHCKCCVECRDVRTCKYACPEGKKRATEIKAAEDEAVVRDRENQKAEHKKRNEYVKSLWLPLIKRVSGLVGNRETLISVLDACAEETGIAWLYTDEVLEAFCFDEDISDYDVLDLEDVPLSLFTSLCRQLSVSADYLLGLSDEKEVAGHA